MPKVIFSTADLYASILLSPLSASKRTAGGAPVNTPSLISAGGSPVSFAMGSSYSTSDWAVVDLGAPMDVSQVVLNLCSMNVSISGWVDVWVSNDATLVPAAGGTTALAPTTTVIPTSTPQSITVAAPANGSVNGRYLIIAMNGQNNGDTFSFSNVQVYAPQVLFGTMQTLGLSDMPGVRKDLFGPLQNSARPVDTADAQLKHEISGESCDLIPEMLGVLAAAVYAVRTNLASAIAVNATTTTLASAAGLSVGETIVVDPGGANPETVTITAINTGTRVVTISGGAGAGGGFAFVHASGVPVVQTSTDATLTSADRGAINRAEVLNVGQLPNVRISAQFAFDDGTNMIWTANKCKADTFDLKTTLADWAKNAVKFSAYPDMNSVVYVADFGY